ncbi:MAG: LytR family transcriptional regulator [Clostridiales bacterium]|nr:LytR family transcriptional regulator [Clostridiales bacterium]
MLKRFIAAALLVCLTLTSCVPALAAKPREIYPLDYDTMPEPAPGQHHYLLTCVDSWDGTMDRLGNTDGTILVTMDTEAKRLIFTTFSREMLVQRPDGEIGRFTYIAKNYGMDAMCRTISTHFGVKVDKYIIFNMDNVQDIIDAMGGVYITVTDAEADYLNRYRISRDSTTPSMGKGGTYLFSGHAAVIYMRIRKVGGDGDNGRMRRMRTVLSTLASKYSEVDLGGAMELLDAVLDCIVGTNMSMQDMMAALYYAFELRGVTPEGLQMPPVEALEPITYAGMDTRQVDFEFARKAFYEFLNPGLSMPDEFTVQN